MLFEKGNRAKLEPVLLALCLVAMAPAHADGVYKWVDENGRAHYTDKPPTQGGHTRLRAPAAPDATQSESGGPAIQLTPADRESELATKRFQEEQRERERVAQEKAKADQKRNEEKMAEAKARDDELMAECRRNREIYCDQGVEKIRREQEFRLIDEEEARKRRISGRYR